MIVGFSFRFCRPRGFVRGAARVGALAGALLLSACVGSPNPELDWGLRDDGWNMVYDTAATVAPTEPGESQDAYAVPDNAPELGASARVSKVEVSSLDAPSAPKAEPRKVASLSPVSQVPPGAPQFAWPLRGRLLSAYGDTEGGSRNDGINIAAAEGAPIHAAAAGTVGYAGDGIKGYGNLVLIRHAGNYFTAYAHADRLTVKVGEHVDAGQVIGYAGQSGDVTAPQLHFEIRYGKKPVNPTDFLGTAPRG